MKYVKKKLSELKPYENNPRINDEAVDDVAESILSFMMAVTTLSLPSLIMLKKAIKPKLMGAFVAICVVGIVIVGYGFNIFQNLFI